MYKDLPKDWKKARFQAIRKAWWDNTFYSEQGREFASIHDCIVDILAKKPTSLQLQAVFLILPDEILGKALLWGFSDTEVREEIYAFIAANMEQVKTACGV